MAACEFSSCILLIYAAYITESFGSSTGFLYTELGNLVLQITSPSSLIKRFIDQCFLVSSSNLSFLSLYNFFCSMEIIVFYGFFPTDVRGLNLLMNHNTTPIFVFSLLDLFVLEKISLTISYSFSFFFSSSFPLDEVQTFVHAYLFS
jgi:hypothetical protein